MRIVELAIGTLLTILLIIRLLKSKKFDEMLDALEGDYPLKDFYGIGLSWNETKLFMLKGHLKDDLMEQARLLYNPRYTEYYATITWAQTITFVHLSLCIGFLLGGMLDFTFFSIVGIVCAAFFGYYFFTKMKNTLETRRTECVVELPEIVSTMALLMNSGMVLKEIWKIVAYSKDGEVYELMQNACTDMENGMPEKDAIYKFGILSNTPEIKKFTSVLIQGIDKGSKDLAEILADQSTEMLELKKQIMLQKGEAAASKLLIPTVMIFGGILVIVISAAFGMLM